MIPLLGVRLVARARERVLCGVCCGLWVVGCVLHFSVCAYLGEKLYSVLGKRDLGSWGFCLFGSAINTP